MSKLRFTFQDSSVRITNHECTSAHVGLASRGAILKCWCWARIASTRLVSHETMRRACSIHASVPTGRTSSFVVSGRVLLKSSQHIADTALHHYTHESAGPVRSDPIFSLLTFRRVLQPTSRIPYPFVKQRRRDIRSPFPCQQQSADSPCVTLLSQR